MVIILSPSKTMTTSDNLTLEDLSTPLFKGRAFQLANLLSGYSMEEIRKLMSVSDGLARHTVDTYKSFISTDISLGHPAVFSYTGAVFTGLNPASMTHSELEYANENLRILSALFGVLKPLDRILPYRLEMTTKLQVDGHKNLYSFWKEDITKYLNEAIQKSGSQYLANLASLEYFKAIAPNQLQVPILNFNFYEMKDGKKKFVSYNAKKARGVMAAFLIKNRITTPDLIRGFDEDGYVYEETADSNPLEFTFVRY